MLCGFKMRKRPLMSVSYLQSEVDGAGSGPGGLMRGVLFFVVWLAGCAAASAEPCAGNPGALGTSRVLTVSPNDFRRIGSMQYAQSLPLKDHEVVLTFDDGPIPPYTNEILDTLASQCVKATYFLVGEMARAYPSIVRRLYNAGHTIGTHSQNHPFAFQRLPMTRVEQQVDAGIASVDAALGDPKAIAPFFRIPGLGRTDAVEGYLASKSLVVWSADVVADDWKHISAKEIVKRAMRRLSWPSPPCSRSSRSRATISCRWWRQASVPTLCLSRLRQRTPARKYGRGSSSRNPRIRPSKRRCTIAPRSPRASTGGPRSSAFMSRITAPIR